MFLPAFSFTVIGYQLFERLLSYHRVRLLFDGIACSTLGLLLNSALKLIGEAVVTPTDAVIFVVALGCMLQLKHRFLAFFVVLFGALAGFMFKGSPGNTVPAM